MLLKMVKVIYLELSFDATNHYRHSLSEKLDHGDLQNAVRNRGDVEKMLGTWISDIKELQCSI
jgi:hypothetical protein